MKTSILILLMLAMSANCLAQSQEDAIKRPEFYAAESALLLDGLQTRQIALQPQLFYENNIILGIHPSVAMVNVYFGVLVVGNYYLTKNLEPETAKKVNTAIVTVEAVVIIRNILLGILFF